MNNNLENKQQGANGNMPEPIRLGGYEAITGAQNETDIDQAINEKQKEEALKARFLKDEAEVAVKQEKGEEPTSYTKYKLAVLEELLKNKSVDFSRLARQLRDPNKPEEFDLPTCYDAFEMIRYYSNNPNELAGDYKTDRFMELSQDPAQYVEDVANLINKISQQKQTIIKREADLGIPASKHDRYRLAILNKLLKENRVDVPKLAREMKQTEGDNFDLEAFKDAYLILDRETKDGLGKTAPVEDANQVETQIDEGLEEEPIIEKSNEEQVKQSTERLDNPELNDETATRLEDVEEAIIEEMPDQPAGDLPLKKTKAKIIAGVLYKTIASVTGVKSIIDWIGAGLGKLGLKVGQRTDVYKYFDQKKETAQDRGQLDSALDKLIEVATTNYEVKQEIYQDQRYIDLVAEIDRLQASYNQESDVEIKAVLAEEIKKNHEEKKKIAEQYDQTTERVDRLQELKKLAVEYNQLVDKARSADYYDLPKDQRQKIDENWDKLSEEEKKLYSLSEADKRTMKIRLGQILIGNLDKKDNLAKQKGESVQGVLTDYIHGKVEASTLIKDSLNSALTLTGAGVLRGLAYGTMAAIERADVKDREFRKEYSWNEIGAKLSGSRRLMDLFTVSMKETYHGLAGRRFSQKYTLAEDGKLQCSAEQVKLTGQEGFVLRLKSLGEIVRLFGIGSQTAGAVINDGASLEKSMEAIANTFKGDVCQNMLNNWYENFRIDQRLAKSWKVLQGRFGQGNQVTIEEIQEGAAIDQGDQVAVEAAMVTGLNTEGTAIDLDNLEDLDTNKIAWLAEQSRPVIGGGSISEALGRPVSGQESVLMINFNSQGEPIIYDGYDLNIIAPGARVLDYNGRLVVIDNNPAHLNFYEQHYFKNLSEEISKKIDGSLEVKITTDPIIVKGESSLVTGPVKYSDDPFFNLAAKDISYEDLANGDAQLYRQFLLADRPGGLFNNKDHYNQDLGSDIDRIYYNRDLSIEDRIKILEGIKQEIIDLKTNNQLYNRQIDVIDHSVELLRHTDSTSIPKEWNGGLSKFVEWQAAGKPIGQSTNMSSGDGSLISKMAAFGALNDVDKVSNFDRILYDPNSNFDTIKKAIMEIIPKGQSFKCANGKIIYYGIDGNFSINGRNFNEQNYLEIIHARGNMLNSLTNSEAFLKIEEAEVDLSKLSIDSVTENLETWARIDQNLFNPEISSQSKIDELMSLLKEGKTISTQNFVFMRHQDKLYLKIDSKIIALSAEVIDRLLKK